MTECVHDPTQAVDYTITNTHISHCQNQYSGGGIAVKTDVACLVIQNVLISECAATGSTASGGAVFVYGPNWCDISCLTAVKCTAAVLHPGLNAIMTGSVMRDWECMCFTECYDTKTANQGSSPLYVEEASMHITSLNTTGNTGPLTAGFSYRFKKSKSEHGRVSYFNIRNNIGWELIRCDFSGSGTTATISYGNIIGNGKCESVQYYRLSTFSCATAPTLLSCIVVGNNFATEDDYGERIKAISCRFDTIVNPAKFSITDPLPSDAFYVVNSQSGECFNLALGTITEIPAVASAGPQSAEAYVAVRFTIIMIYGFCQAIALWD